MGYRIAGAYTAVCNCRLLCPCPVGGVPTGPGETCDGVIVFRIDEGSLDGIDLSGVAFALYNHFPAALTAGDWTVGLVVDREASEEQARAVERIVSGQEGGPFGEFVPLIGEYRGMERAAISYGEGAASVEGRTEVSFQPLTGPDGGVTTVRNAMFGFAPEFTVGKGSGHSHAFGLRFSADGSYGERARFEFSSEAVGAVHPRA